jgi:hypothetical protein
MGGGWVGLERSPLKEKFFDFQFNAKERLFSHKSNYLTSNNVKQLIIRK